MTKSAVVLGGEQEDNKGLHRYPTEGMTDPD